MRLLLLVCFLSGLSLCVWGQKKTRMPEPINLWDYEEYAPSVSADGKTLIFQSDRYGVLVSGARKVPEIDSEGHKNRILNQEKASFFGIYETRLHQSGQWSRPEPVDAINRYSGGMTPVMGGPSISYDGNYLYFFAYFPDDKSAYGKEDLYYSVREKYGWSKPVNLGPEVNTPGYEGFPSISSDGRHLYFVREDLTKKALGEERCYRIMRSEKDAGGNWKRPIELPAPVNMDCEKAPRIMADNKTLVFSSIKKKNKGSFDLYISRLGADGLWSEPRPLDFVNSKHADQSVAISACGDEMYYISNGDIYTISIPEELRPEKMMTIQGFVADAGNQGPVSARVMLRDVKTDKIIASAETSLTDGRYTLLAPQGGLYEVEIDHRNYRTARKKADLQNVNHCEIIQSDFKLERTRDVAKRSDIIIEEVAVSTSQPGPQKTAEAAPARVAPPESGIETEVIAARRSAPKVVSIVEEERANLTEGKQVVTDSLKEAEKGDRRVDIPKEKAEYTVTLLVRDGDNNSVIRDVKLSAENIKYDFDAERNAFEVKVSESDSYRIVISAPGYQPEEYRIQEVNASKRVVVQLFPELPSNLTVMVTDINTGEPLSSTIDIKGSGADYSMENPSGKSVIEFNQARQIELTIRAPGYTTLKKELTIEVAPEGRVYQLDARLEKVIYTLRASALDKETRQALTAAQFYLSSPDHKNLETGARQAGEYLLPGFGKYTVRSLVSGYQDQFLELEVDKNITEVVFEMVKKAKPTKETALVIIDEYTREPLSAVVKTSALLLQNNPPVIQLEEGASAEAEIQVNAYPSQKIQLDYGSTPDQVEVRLKKELYPFRFRVISEANRRVLTNAGINILDDKTRARFEVSDGVADALLAPGKEYTIMVSADGHSGTQLKFQSLQALYDNLRERIIPLKPLAAVAATENTSSDIRIETKEFGVIEKGRSVQLNNIYFDQSSPVLKPESHTELDQLARVLQDNAGIRIEVRGYTDNQGDFNKNVQLSKDRCQAVINYLVSKGIAAGRMAPVGRGPLDPVAPNNTEENRSKNRRVEFVVL